MVQNALKTVYTFPRFQVLKMWVIIFQVLKEENVSLSSELKTTKERTAGEGEESPIEAAVCVVETKQTTPGSAAPAANL